MNMKKGLVAVDLFCGAGGLTKGLSDAGINVLKGYDSDAKVSETYERNNRRSNFFHMDVVKLKKKELLDGIDRENNFFLLAGCAPCQPFSLINRKGIEGDDRRNLVLKFGRLIRETLPDFVFMENVPGLVNGKGKVIFKKFLAILDNYKYFYDYKVLNVADYGVPQRRKRLVLIASKGIKVKIPGNLSSDNIVTLKEILTKYPPIKAGEKHPGISNHEARGLSELNLERLQRIRKNGGSRTDLPSEFILKCHKKHKGHTDVYGRMSFDNLAPTLTCKCTSISNGRFGHPTQNRAISVREAAAIQTFPDDYEFYGNMSENTRWVGNAVPVMFARAFGEYFINLSSNAN